MNLVAVLPVSSENMHACKILPRILIDNLDCFRQTLNSNVDAYHGK